MNDVERFLLDNWQEAYLLEQAMQTVRNKYKELFQRVSDAVAEAHPELDASKSYPTQFWQDGQIGFGRSSWPDGPAGLWVGGLRLENLTDENADPPYAMIWIPKKANLDTEAARRDINAAAEKVLTREELKGANKPESGEQLLWLPAPPKGQLLTALARDDGQEFVDLFVAQFDMMARFVPAIDGILASRVRSS
jgi:hypothetical protein